MNMTHVERAEARRKVVDAWLKAHVQFLHHSRFCAADNFYGLGCNCGLREWAWKMMQKETDR